jgi:hypothetical protein
MAPLSAQNTPTTVFQQAAFTGAKVVTRTNVIAGSGETGAETDHSPHCGSIASAHRSSDAAPRAI